jgi:hypothetical protein
MPGQQLGSEIGITSGSSVQDLAVLGPALPPPAWERRKQDAKLNPQRRSRPGNSHTRDRRR